MPGWGGLARLEGGAVDAYIPLPILHLHDYHIIRTRGENRCEPECFPFGITNSILGKNDLPIIGTNQEFRFFDMGTGILCLK